MQDDLVWSVLADMADIRLAEVALRQPPNVHLSPVQPFGVTQTSTGAMNFPGAGLPT